VARDLSQATDDRVHLGEGPRPLLGLGTEGLARQICLVSRDHTEFNLDDGRRAQGSVRTLREGFRALLYFIQVEQGWHVERVGVPSVLLLDVSVLRPEHLKTHEFSAVLGVRAEGVVGWVGNRNLSGSGYSFAVDQLLSDQPRSIGVHRLQGGDFGRKILRGHERRPRRRRVGPGIVEQLLDQHIGLALLRT